MFIASTILKLFITLSCNWIIDVFMLPLLFFGVSPKYSGQYNVLSGSSLIPLSNFSFSWRLFSPYEYFFSPRCLLQRFKIIKYLMFKSKRKVLLFFSFRSMPYNWCNFYDMTCFQLSWGVFLELLFTEILSNTPKHIHTTVLWLFELMHLYTLRTQVT